ncbi:MAG: hypothetical protein FWH22_09385 [Fibromonadales bacterium]|nr:hypothetical protein [Fibromonadales bacterium]
MGQMHLKFWQNAANIHCDVAIHCEWAKDFSPLHGVPFGIFRVIICHIRDKRNNNPSTINAVGAKNLSPIRNAHPQHGNERLQHPIIHRNIVYLRQNHDLD